MIRLVVAAAGVGVLVGAGLMSAHYLRAYPASDTAGAVTTLTANTSLISANGDYQLIMTADGDLVENSLHGISPILIEVNDPDGNAYIGGGNASAVNNNNYTVSGALVGSDVVQVWHSGTSSHPGARAILQADGNFVIYSPSNAVLWSTGTAGHPGARLVVQSDANVVLYDGSQALWSTGRVSTVNGHGNSTVNLRNCPGWTDPQCGISRQIQSGKGITMLCWESLAPPAWGTPPPSNKWFYVVVDGSQDDLGFMNAGYVSHQITTPPCIGQLKPGQTAPPVPVAPATTAPASQPVPSQTPTGSGPGPQPTAPATTPSTSTPSAPAAPSTFTETVGGPTHTWTNYSNAGGYEGPTIPTGESVQVACVVQGFKVADGNTNWYKIASSPWNGTYYASADAFYNNGSTSGSLIGTPFVDPRVPAC